LVYLPKISFPEYTVHSSVLYFFHMDRQTNMTKVMCSSLQMYFANASEKSMF